MTHKAHPSDSREPVTHNLKTWPDAYDAAYASLKLWEFRKNDRDYRAGDTLRLLRWSPDDQVYTGEEMSRQVTWMLDGGQFGIPDGFCIMSLAALAAPGGEGVAWVSPKQLAALVTPEPDEGGQYLPVRKSKAGLFTQPLFTVPPEPVAWRPDRESVARIIMGSVVKGHPVDPFEGEISEQGDWDQLAMADAILALSAPPSASESEGADWLSDAHDEALDFLDRKYPDESEGA